MFVGQFRDGKKAARLLLTFMFAGVAVPLVLPEEAKKPDEAIVSQVTEWKETLKYGIDSQVIELLDRMRADKDERLSDEILGIFSVTRNTKVRESSLRYFIEMNNAKAEKDVLALLDSNENHPAPILLGCLEYLGKIKSVSLAEKALPLIPNQNKGVASAAIRAVGTSGNDSHVETLLSRFEEEDFDTNLKADIILALGELKAGSAVEKLTSILEDDESEPVWRRYACVSLGKIGRPESLQKIMNAYVNADTQADTMMRSYALSGVAEYEGEEVVNFLIDALKDSFWKVRISAIQGLSKRKAVTAVPVLIYKAKLDPENNVKLEAMKALSEMATDEALRYLLEVMNSKKAAQSLRETATGLLVEKHLAFSMSSLDPIITEEWDKKDSRILDLIGKLLSQKEEKGLEKYFERFLSHSSLSMKIYGIRGIERNHLTQFRERIVELTGEKVSPVVKKAALAALEKL